MYAIAFVIVALIVFVIGVAVGSGRSAADTRQIWQEGYDQAVKDLKFQFNQWDG